MGSNQYIPQIALCPECKEHGHFTMPGAEYSLEFCSIEGARKVLESNQITYRLHQPEIQLLREAVEAIELPTKDCHAVMTIQDDVKSWNEEFSSFLRVNIVLQYAAHDHRLQKTKAALV